MSELKDLVRADANVDLVWEQAAEAAAEGRRAEIRAAYNRAEYNYETSVSHADAGDREARRWSYTFQDLMDVFGGFLGITPSYAGPDPEAESERRYFDLADPAYQYDLRTPWEETLEADDFYYSHSDYPED
jgi:hypothetical protein